VLKGLFMSLYGPVIGARAASIIGPMDDPVRLMAQRAIEGQPIYNTDPGAAGNFQSLAAILSQAGLSADELRTGT